ncbi:heme ABC transporter ATP-binding protein [Jatrophihabitans sp. DSM 45814]
MIALSVRRAVATRGRRAVLDGIDLDVETGELLALVGPNGAGKSTLLHLMAGDERPATGEVSLLGRGVHAWSPREAALRRSVLPQQHSMAFPFAVADVVAMGRWPWRGMAEAAEDEREIEAAMQKTAVAEFRHRAFTSLSGGEAARVSLARVLAQRSRVLLLDEPTAALDPHHQERTFAVLRELADAGHAVVAVVHDLNLAGAYSDRVAILGRGKIQASGPPSAVLRTDVLSEVYGHAMEVIEHPRTGLPLIGPRR